MNYVIAIAGVSGVGKSFLSSYLANTGLVEYMPSITTRRPRKDEIHGRDKYFLNENDFNSLLQKKQLICTERMLGYNYGTSLKHIREMQLQISVITICGHNHFRELKEELSVVTIYIQPSSIEYILNSINKRTISEDEKQSRISLAIKELNDMKKLENRKYTDYFYINNFEEKSKFSFYNFIKSIINQ